MFLALNGVEERLQIVFGQAAPGPLATPPGHGLCHASERSGPGKPDSYLAPGVDAGLKALGLTPSELAGVACVRGPGSFTGVRLVLSFALGLSRAAGLPLAGIDYLPLLAQNARALAGLHSGSIFVLTHSRRDRVYAQAFAIPETPSGPDGAGLVPLAPPQDLLLAEAATLGLAAPRPLHVLGAGLRRNPDFFAQALHAPDISFLDPLFDHPSPETLLAAALCAPYSHEPIAPLYLRLSDAECEVETFARVRGLDPDAEREKLARLTSETAEIEVTRGEE